MDRSPEGGAVRGPGLQALGTRTGLPHDLLVDAGRAAVDAARERAWPARP